MAFNPSPEVAVARDAAKERKMKCFTSTVDVIRNSSN